LGTFGRFDVSEIGLVTFKTLHAMDTANKIMIIVMGIILLRKVVSVLAQNDGGDDFTIQ